MHVFLRLFYSQIVYAIKCMNAFVYQHTGSRRSRDHIVVEFTTTYAIRGYHHRCCEFESRSGRDVQYYVIRFSVTCDRSIIFPGSSGFLHQ